METLHKEVPCQVAIHLSMEEADALLNLLMCVPATDDVPEEMAAQLLRRVMEAQRTNLRATAVELAHEVYHP